MLNFRKISEYKKALNEYDVKSFNNNIDRSYLHMLLRVDVKKFRHITNLKMGIDHPITVIAGTNKVGKTSMLLLIACSFEEFWKYDSTKPDTAFKKATWKDVISFTTKETDKGGYEYVLKWRLGDKTYDGIGKRNTGAKTSWTGLGKASKSNERMLKLKIGM